MTSSGANAEHIEEDICCMYVGKILESDKTPMDVAPRTMLHIIKSKPLRSMFPTLEIEFHRPEPTSSLRAFPEHIGFLSFKMIWSSGVSFFVLYQLTTKPMTVTIAEAKPTYHTCGVRIVSIRNNITQRSIAVIIVGTY